VLRLATSDSSPPNLSDELLDNLSSRQRTWCCTVRLSGRPEDVAYRSVFTARIQEAEDVKFIFSVCADPLSGLESIARTETRVATTDPIAQAKFRRYCRWFHQRSSSFVEFC
jgi:hypothetical protein